MISIIFIYFLAKDVVHIYKSDFHIFIQYIVHDFKNLEAQQISILGNQILNNFIIVNIKYSLFYLVL